MDVSAHGEVDEDEDVEFDEDGEREEDGVQDEARQAQSPVQSPFVQVDTKNLRIRTEQSRREISLQLLFKAPTFYRHILAHNSLFITIDV